MHKLPIIILRTSRFFPEEDDSGNTEISGDNFKANEFLYLSFIIIIINSFPFYISFILLFL